MPIQRRLHERQLERSRAGSHRRESGPVRLQPSALFELGGEANVKALVERNLHGGWLTTRPMVSGVLFKKVEGAVDPERKTG